MPASWVASRRRGERRPGEQLQSADDRLTWQRIDGSGDADRADATSARHSRRCLVAAVTNPRPDLDPGRDGGAAMTPEHGEEVHRLPRHRHVGDAASTASSVAPAFSCSVTSVPMPSKAVDPARRSRRRSTVTCHCRGGESNVLKRKPMKIAGTTSRFALRCAVHLLVLDREQRRCQVRRLEADRDQVGGERQRHRLEVAW